MGKSSFELADKIGYYSPTDESDSNIHFPTKSSSFQHSSIFEEKSLFKDEHLQNEALSRIERKLKDIEKANSNAPNFAANENKKGNPKINGFGHGDIEKIALKDLFNEKEISEVYYGNWLRDFSQFLFGMTIRPDEKITKQFYSKYNLNSHEQKIFEKSLNAFTQDNWVILLEILAAKEFVWNIYFKKDKSKMPYTDGKKYIEEFRANYPKLTRDTLGIYRPEEHIDNPKSQKDESKLSYINFNYEYEKGKQKNLKLYKGETAQSLFINGGKNSIPDLKEDPDGKFFYNPQGLKYYIFNDIDDDRPSSITYFRQQLKLAVDYGNNKEGRMYLGAALHIMEDYFAHSNFVEICLIKLIDEEVYPWVKYVDEPQWSFDKKQVKDFWKDQKKWIISNPTSEVKNEKANCIPIVTGVFLPDDALASVGPKLGDALFELSYEPFELRKEGDRHLFDILALTILQVYVEKQKNEKKEKPKFDASFWLAFYNDYLLLIDKICAIKNRNKITKILFNIIGNVTGKVSFVMSYIPKLLLNIIFSNSGKAIKEAQSLNYGSDPTHTQIAKDAFDHPLNTLAATLAIEAVKEVTTVFLNSVKENKLSSENEKMLLEKYFVHPCKTDWMNEIVKNWSVENSKKLKRLRSPTKLKAIEYEIKAIDQNSFLSQFNSLINIFHFLNNS